MKTQSSDLHCAAEQLYRNEVRLAAYEKRKSNERKLKPLPESGQANNKFKNVLILILMVLGVAIVFYGLLIMAMTKYFITGDA
ncbi:MAG: hypothetical protein KME67_05160 [Candidatus Thiodiazotropha sp. (ex Codakia orbicularis)]|nr:hypothetical protein [Candidatus Thiodiazotropha sp. (ex Codakia orbicularis)]